MKRTASGTTRPKEAGHVAHDPDASQLSDEVRQLTEEVRVLRMAVDELREEIQWGNRNRGDASHEQFTPVRIWSLPLDPADEDFGERINRVPPQTVEALRAEAVGSTPAASSPAQQQNLW